MRPDMAHAVAVHEQLRQRVLQEFPDIDEETLGDTLEGLSALPDLIAALIRSHLEDAATAEALKLRVGKMQERLTRIERRAATKRALAAEAMERAEIRRLNQPDFTASLRPLPAGVVVTDEAAVPEPFWRPQPPKLDRRALAEALKTGQSIPGATLSNGGTTLSLKVT